MTPMRFWFLPRGDALGWVPASREGWILLMAIVVIGAVVGRIA